MKNNEAVILNEYEVNLRDDSDFYCVIYDRSAKKLEVKLYDTTRAGIGYDIRKEYLPKSEATEADFDAAKAILKAHAEQAAEACHAYDLENNIAKAGDLVRVVKGRKYSKGHEFIVESTKEMRGNFHADYLIGQTSEYINNENVEIVSQAACMKAVADFGILTRR